MTENRFLSPIVLIPPSFVLCSTHCSIICCASFATAYSENVSSTVAGPVGEPAINSIEHLWKFQTLKIGLCGLDLDHLLTSIKPGREKILSRAFLQSGALARHSSGTGERHRVIPELTLELSGGEGEIYCRVDGKAEVRVQQEMKEKKSSVAIIAFSFLSLSFWVGKIRDQVQMSEEADADIVFMR